MPRDYKVCLEDILEAIKRIRDYTPNFSLASFSSDFKTFDAVVRNLEVIGEAAKGIPDGVRAQSPGIEWKRITGLRDILIHRTSRNG